MRISHQSRILLPLLGLITFLCLPTASARAQANLGTAYVTSVTGVGGSCVAGPDGKSVQSWEVAQGGTYTVTLSNVTECSGGTINVLVHSSATGNMQEVATQTSAGTYTFNVSIPANGCLTMPIEYCVDSSFGPGTGEFAQGYKGGTGSGFQAHLRVSSFDANCNWLGEITTCGGGPPPPAGCTITITCGDINECNDGGQTTWTATEAQLESAITILGGDNACTGPFTYSFYIGSDTTGTQITPGTTTLPIGTDAVTCVVSAPNGSTGTSTSLPCTFNVVVNNCTIQIGCKDFTKCNDPTQCFWTTTLADLESAVSVTSSSTCPGPYTYTFYQGTGTSGPVIKPGTTTLPFGTNPVTCVVTSAASGSNGSCQSLPCTFNVIVKDCDPPLNPCKTANQTITVNTDANQCYATVDLTPDLVAGKPCITSPDPVTLSFTSVPPLTFNGNVAQFPIGTTTVTITATDTVNGLTNQCSITVVVNNNNPPMITCPTTTPTYNLTSGQCYATVNFNGLATGTAACQTSDPVTISYSPMNSPGLSPGQFAPGTYTITATATDNINQLSASCQFTLQVNPPTFSLNCPGNVTLPNDPGKCYATYYPSGATTSGNCGGDSITISYSPAGPYQFPIGTTTVTATATDNTTGQTASCTFTVTVLSSINGSKFYDANANGTWDAGEPGIAGWTVKLTEPNGTVLTTTTDVNGNYSFTLLPPGTYKVTEVIPTASWQSTTGASFTVTLAPGSGGCPQTVNFGNVCLGAGGAFTLGFWSNSNGKAAMTTYGMAASLALVSYPQLNSRNANGSFFSTTSYNTFASWLLGANATNMAYMLSAQLATMELNVAIKKVSTSSLVYAPGTHSANLLGYATLGALMTEANTQLGTTGTVLGSSTLRVYWTALETALNNANNNQSFVQSGPCPH